MEIFNKLPFELQGMVLSHSLILGDATPAQLELFHSLPPDVQEKVYNNAFTSDDVRDYYKYRCKPRYGSCARFLHVRLVLGFWLRRGVPSLPPARHVLEVQGEERSSAGAAQRAA